MTIKNIYNKFKIHPLNYLLMIIVALAGLYKEFLIIFFIIIIHELGHFSAALIYNWKVKSINIYPFGGCINFSESPNKPLYQELVIMLAGPFVQMLLFFLIYFFMRMGIVSFKLYFLFKNYHYSILFFNLLPALPLDGGRLLNILMCYLRPYKKSLKYSIYFSYFIFLILIVVNHHNFNMLLLVIFLTSKVIIENRNIDYSYNMFLLDRYLNNYDFKKTKTIKDKDNIYKDHKHIIHYQDRYVTEKEYLKKRFGNN